jgi:hypothetical protein
VDIPEGAKPRQELVVAKRKRRKPTPEFKADAVKLVQSGRGASEVVGFTRTLTKYPPPFNRQMPGRDVGAITWR